MKTTLLLGDCVERLVELPEQSVDLVVTSPPYDDLRTYGGGYVFDFEATAQGIVRALKPGGVIVWIINDATKDGSETGTSFKQALYFKDQCGLSLHDTMIWLKYGFPNQQPNRYNNVFEYMFIFSKGRPKTSNLIADKVNKYAGHTAGRGWRNPDGSVTPTTAKKKQTKIKSVGFRNNVWDIPAVQSVIERTGHPAQYPEALARDHIISWSNEGDLVLDPFMGSGTTGVACRQTNRDFIGIEINPEYFEIAKKRIEATGYQTKLIV